MGGGVGGRWSNQWCHMKIVLIVTMGKIILGLVRVVLAMLLLWPDPVSRSTREHTGVSIRCPSVSALLIPTPLNLNQSSITEVNMSCLVVPCCAINPAWELEISPGLSLFQPICPGCSVFLHSWHSKQNKIYPLVFFLVFSYSVYKSSHTFSSLDHLIVFCLPLTCLWAAYFWSVRFKGPSYIFWPYSKHKLLYSNRLK